MRVIWTALFVGTLALTLAACGTTTPADVDLGQDSSPIINGELPDEPMHNAVVSLHERVGDTWYSNIYCSGTLIAPNVVLTAAHCLDEGRRKFDPIEADEVVVYVGDNPMTDPSPSVYVVTEVMAHGSYSPTALTNDIGLLRLASSPSVTPVAALPASLGLTSADEGATVNFAGFGADENDNYDQKLQVDGVLDHLYSASQIYYYQYDAGPCFGDSGGPTFIKRGGTPYVIGVTSYGDSYCAQYGISTRPDYYNNWINDFIGVIADPFCGDGNCDADEDCDNCEADCGVCPSVCGDGTCDSDESCSSCEADCGVCQSYCGDGTCDADEDCDSCSDDCGDCPSVCGDGTCDSDEDCNSCEMDCGACQTCGSIGDYCESASDCCSGRCHPRKHTCK